MSIRSLLIQCGLLLLALVLGGCANQSMPGYQRVYQGHQVPANLADTVQQRMRSEGLQKAQVGRDGVGRLRLAGQYRDEDEVERAFLISQSIVGIKSTSPFYPENVVDKRWTKEAGNALADFYKRKQRQVPAGQGRQRALVIGINQFKDYKHLTDIQGEDDARLMGMVLANYGYEVQSVLGERATKANIEAAIAEMEKTLGENDTLFIYVSSHGNPPVPTPGNNDERRMSIAAYDSGDADPTKPPSRDKTAYLLNLQRSSVRDTLVQQLAQKNTAVTRVIIDTCYSGEILKDLPSEGAAYQAQVNGGGYEREAVSVASWTGKAYSSKAITYAADDKSAGPQSKTAAAGKTAAFEQRKNYTFITATSPGELSLGPPVNVGTFGSPLVQSEVLRGSFFTQSFIAYLKHYGGDVAQAFAAAKTFTSQTAQRVSKGELTQNPTRFSTLAPSGDKLSHH